MRAAALISALALALGAGCTETERADVIIAMPVEVQLAAHRACHEQLRIAAPFQPNVLRLRGGGAVVSAVNASGMTLAEARAVNQCARARLLSGTGQQAVVVNPDPRLVAVDPSPGLARVGTGATILRIAPGCPPGASVLYGGTRYCVQEYAP